MSAGPILVLVQSKVIVFGTISGEIVYIGDPFDVGDWEIIYVQLDCINTSGSFTAGDVKCNVDTSLSSADYAKYDACLADQDAPMTAGGSVVLSITSASTTPLRKWARLYVKHNVTTPSQVLTVHATVFYKKRVP